MRIITYVCDECLTDVAERIVAIKEKEETHLFPAGFREVCLKCLEKKGLACWSDKRQIARKFEIEGYE